MNPEYKKKSMLFAIVGTGSNCYLPCQLTQVKPIPPFAFSAFPLFVAGIGFAYLSLRCGGEVNFYDRKSVCFTCS